MARPPIILYQLNKDISRVLEKYLTQRRWLEQHCVAEIIALLNRRLYREKLLFRDYAQYTGDMEDGGETGAGNFGNESWFYVGMLLSRRIALANKLQEQPTTLHNLLLLLCRNGSDDHWRDAELRRRLNGEAKSEDFFAAVAKQLHELKNNYRANSEGRLQQYGPYWLTAQNSAAQVVEELALADVLRTAPSPLLDGFSVCREWEITFAKVLETLNERYGLLRSLGLRPDLWLEREKPAEPGEDIDSQKVRKLLLSTENLKALKSLKKRAETLLRSGEVRSTAAAYRQAFDTCRGTAKTFAGFENFEAFENSEAGQHLLGYTLQDPDDPDYSRDVLLKTEETPYDWAVMQEQMDALRQRMLELLQASPGLFDALLAYFFQEVFGKSRPLFGADGLLQDPEFRRLSAADADYRDLSDVQRAQLLEKRMKQIIRKQLEDGDEP